MITLHKKNLSFHDVYHKIDHDQHAHADLEVPRRFQLRARAPKFPHEGSAPIVELLLLQRVHRTFNLAHRTTSHRAIAHSERRTPRYHFELHSSV